MKRAKFPRSCAVTASRVSRQLGVDPLGTPVAYTCDPHLELLLGNWSEAVGGPCANSPTIVPMPTLFCAMNTPITEVKNSGAEPELNEPLVQATDLQRAPPAIRSCRRGNWMLQQKWRLTRQPAFMNDQHLDGGT